MDASSRKKIQRERMWHYFVDAAVEVIEEEGIDKVTIRKVADRAGYTSSTVYNYFQDLNHLIFFAALRFTQDYIDALPKYMEKGNNVVEKWLYSWVCFCKYSFEQPKIYDIIYVKNLGVVPHDFLEYYYQTYKDHLMGLPKHIKDIITKHQFSKRSSLYLQGAVDEGLMEPEDVDIVAETTMLIWAGMITTFLNNRDVYSKEQAIEKTLHYVYQTVQRFVRHDIGLDFTSLCSGDSGT